MNELFPGVYRHQNRLWTENRVPGQSVYNEKRITLHNHEYREWMPHHSKLAAAIQNGLKELPIKPHTNTLYLGSAEGTTVSHLSDIIRDTGIIIGLDASARVMPKFIRICEQRSNLIPLLADANHPETYAKYLEQLSIHVLFQDIAQANQAEIFLANSRFLSPHGKGLLVIKTASINSSQAPETVLQEQTKQLKSTFNLIQTIRLDPYEKNHWLLYCDKKT